MCVILLKDVGKPLPGPDVLKKCWDTNSDGAGILIYNEAHGLRCFKGFMKYPNLLEKLAELSVQDSDLVAIHFRIKTSGLSDPQRTHPFPVCDDLIQMKALDFTPTMALMHNGVLGQGKGKNSDTMLFVQDYLKYGFWEGVFEDGNLLEMLSKISTGSRLLLVNNQGKYVKTGTWVDVDGISYSNSNWNRVVYTYNSAESKYGAYYSNWGYRSPRTGYVGEDWPIGINEDFEHEVSSGNYTEGVGARACPTCKNTTGITTSQATYGIRKFTCPECMTQFDYRGDINSVLLMRKNTRGTK